MTTEMAAKLAGCTENSWQINKAMVTPSPVLRILGPNQVLSLENRENPPPSIGITKSIDLNL